ncbi:MAG: tRNA (N(6)-L-threonylcarbamoyladenosine(37)-C(2))-methylthiotransferase MtaB [Anaerolineales bacterium]|nr:tRNA (N(6)-L-threonylcarbamoyladenosine(37)-C(2))-methylthiotransferase MtaB [Anaerolineales bacterium]
MNQSEIETYARQLSAAGHDLVAHMDEADMMVLNTCTVTAAAASDSRQKVRQAHKAGIQQIVVTGCLSTIKPESIRKMPGVVQLVPNSEKDTLVARLLNLPNEALEKPETKRQPIPGSRMRTRAFIKAQDGCDNSCTFCITTVARGEGRSYPIDQVINDVHTALRGGAKEIVLTGVHLGSWGHDFENTAHLADLISALLKIQEIPRLRVSSLEPWDLDASFFSLWQDPRLCRHLHLPLQSGSAAVLRRMARKITPEGYARLVEEARSQIEDIAITTDLIAGFPGESEEEFKQGLDFVRQMNFAGVHVFTFSARQGTAAARMPHQVHNYLRKERSAVLREAAAEDALRFHQKFIGREMNVLWESAFLLNQNGKWQLNGLTDNYLRVRAESDTALNNQITPVILREILPKPLAFSGKITQYPDTISLAR